MCGMFSGFGKTCPTDQDLRVPDADKSLPVLEKAGNSGDWGFSGPALTKTVGQCGAV